MADEEEPPPEAAEPPQKKAPPPPKDVHWITLERAEELRATLNLGAAEGPSAAHIQTGIDIYVGRFEWWYGKQLREILGKFVPTLIRRINPYVRRAQLGDCGTTELAEAVVASWESRNFVTAGGQALEALAIAMGTNCQKAVGIGLDIQRVTPDDRSTLHLYVLKSGPITRNSDILAKMKSNVRQAEKLARQHPGTGNVRLNYATSAGTFSTTFADGVHRPSSAKFWSEVFELAPDKAVRLLWLVTLEASQFIRSIETNRKALVAQVAEYISKPGTDRVDWEFLVRVANEPWRSYKDEHVRREREACAKGAAIRSEQAPTVPAVSGSPRQA